ncbi:GDP-fucose protein O-fucosyltransferase, partial [Datura stramonium]|nr:GDP-fucose protein O-fucosyltransferase [Datura stramonium]
AHQLAVQVLLGHQVPVIPPRAGRDKDQQNLIAQSECGNNRSESPVRMTFKIDDVNDETAKPRHFNFSFSKWYFLAIIVPVFILILFFTTDVDNLFGTGFVNANYNVSVNDMREAELRALYILRQQQLGLFKL